MSNAPTQIDQHAPVIAMQNILVNAPLERLWDVHTDVKGWTAWQSDIDTLQSSADRLASLVRIASLKREPTSATGPMARRPARAGYHEPSHIALSKTAKWSRNG